jgi:hypothetical protein
MKGKGIMTPIATGIEITTLETFKLRAFNLDADGHQIPIRAGQPSPRWDVVGPQILTLENNADGTVTVGSTDVTGTTKVVATAASGPATGSLSGEYTVTVTKFEPAGIQIVVEGAPTIDPKKQAQVGPAGKENQMAYDPNKPESATNVRPNTYPSTGQTGQQGPANVNAVGPGYPTNVNPGQPGNPTNAGQPGQGQTPNPNFDSSKPESPSNPRNR